MSANSSVILPLASCPWPVKSILFRSMRPIELFHLSISSKKTCDLLQRMRLKATVNIKFSKNTVTVTVTSASGLTSEIVVGHVYNSKESRFNTMFDKEFFFGCTTRENGVVYPYGLDTILRRLFRVFQCVLHTVELHVDRYNTYSDLDSLVSGLSALSNPAGEVTCEQLRLHSEDSQPMELGCVLRVLQLLKPRKTVDMSVAPSNAVPELSAVHALRVQDGEFMSRAELLALDVAFLELRRSVLNDTSFNAFIHKWLTSNEDKLQFVEIRACSMPEFMEEDEEQGEDVLLRGLRSQPRDVQVDQTWHRGWTIRRDDGKIASIVRAPDTFTFFVLN